MVVDSLSLSGRPLWIHQTAIVDFDLASFHSASPLNHSYSLASMSCDIFESVAVACANAHRLPNVSAVSHSETETPHGRRHATC